MKNLAHFIFGALLILLFGCYRMEKRDVAGSKPAELPPVKIAGVLSAEGDQVPVVRAKEGAGFVEKPIPGATVKTTRPFPYVLYEGRSN